MRIGFWLKGNGSMPSFPREDDGSAIEYPVKKNGVLPAPILTPRAPPSGKWEAERRAFLQLRPSLLATHPGKYVAIHEGKVVDWAEDKIALGLRVYSRFGYLPIFVGCVSTEQPKPVRIPSPRLR